MKTIKLFFVLVIASLLFTSCYVEENHYYDDFSLEEIITDYDIWYVDFNRTTGYGNVPFVSRAFTLTFQNGRMYANNNIVGIGITGNEYGIQTGTYNTKNGILSIHHSFEGTYNFEVIVDNPNSIRLYNAYENVTYFLEGYDADTFDFDQVFYDNLEYFLQEYVEWEKTFTSLEGEINTFEYENFLAFTPDNITTFYSSIDDIGTPEGERGWDFEGSYEVANIYGHVYIKDLTLYYDNGDTEEFELEVIGNEDKAISLYHYASGTTYEFEGWGNIQYKNQGKTSKETDAEINSTGRKRFKVTRKTIERKAHSKTTKREHTKDNKTKAPARK